MDTFRLPYRQLALLIAAMLLIAGCTDGITPTLTPTPIPTLTPTPFPQFVFSGPAPNAEFNADEIIFANGTHNLSPESHAWIFLRDIFKGYYLQSPAIDILADGTWEATNIRLGKEIQHLIAIYVDPEGDRIIQGWVNTDRWGRIEEDEIKNLPGYRELGRVKIKTPGAK